MIFRRRKKLYFQNTVSKFPTVIFIASVIIGVFFLFKIITTLVKESDNSAEFSAIETKTEIKPAAKSSKTTVKEPVEKYQETTVAKRPVKTSQIAEFYTVQVATFSDMRRTENLANQLKGNKYSPVYIKTRDNFFEVCVGNFSSPGDGREVLSKIKSGFHDAFIRKITPPFEER